MDENGTYRWPGGQNTRPKKKPDFKRAGRTVIAVAVALLVLAVALTCFYTVDDKQQAVVTTFGKATNVTEAGVHFKLPLGIQKVPAQLLNDQDCGLQTLRQCAKTGYPFLSGFTRRYGR